MTIIAIDYAQIMRLTLFIFCYLIYSFAFADVYRSVDENGNIVFTDKPSPDAEKVELQEVQTVSPASVPPFKYKKPIL